MKTAGIVLLALLVAVAVFWTVTFKGDDPKRHSVTGDLFVDVTKRSRVDFHFRGDLMDGKLIPTMGAGAALADFDGDGCLDLVLVQQVRSARSYKKLGQTQPLADCTRLYRNRRDGTFEDVTERSGIRACGWGVNAMWADLDGDGWVDLVVGNAGEPNTVWKNNGDGTFSQVKGSGLEGGRFTVGLAALDYDGDGVVDVYVGNYVDSDPGRESKTPPTAFMTPDQYAGQDNFLFRGSGAFRWEDRTAGSGAADPGSKTIGAAAVDYDGDGKTDLYVSNDQWRNTLLHNEGEGKFRDVSDETGTGYPQSGATAFGRRTRSGMGLVAEDLDGDGRPDLVVTNFSNEPNTILRNVEGTLFEEVDEQAYGGAQDPTFPVAKWGIVPFDYDDDGREDLAVSGGQIMSRLFTVVSQWFNPIAKNFSVGEKSYAQRQFLLHNESTPGTIRFADVSPVAGDLGRLVIVGRGLSAGDLDGDGRLDLVFNPIDRKAIVLRNNVKGGGASIEILPVAGKDRKTVLGTRITVNGHAKEFHVVPSYASGSWTPLHYGLGKSSAASVTVRWPDGTSESLGEVKAGAYRLRRGEPLAPLRAER
jgi:enediyne biosynthesis protein E4